MVALAPSTSTRLPALCSSLIMCTVSAMNGVMRSAYFLYASSSASTSYSKSSNLAAASAARVLSFCANVSGFLMSPTRMPLRVALDA